MHLHSLLAVVLFCMLGGCTTTRPLDTADLDADFGGVIGVDERVLLYGDCEIRAGTFMEGEIKMVPAYDGVMLLTNQAVRFLQWDADEQTYLTQVQLPYSELRSVKHKFNTLIPSFVAIRAKDGHAYAFMIADELVTPAFQIMSGRRVGQ